MATEKVYPNLTARVSIETKEALARIEADFGPTPSTIARLALEDYVPRYIAARGKPKFSEFLSSVAPMIEEHPELQAEIEKTVKAFKRTRRIAA